MSGLVVKSAYEIGRVYARILLLAPHHGANAPRSFDGSFDRSFV